MMIDATVCIPINRTTLFDYVADFPRHAEWQTHVAAIVPLTGSAPHVGSLYRVTLRDAFRPIRSRLWWSFGRILWGVSDSAIAELTRLERPTRIGWRTRLPSTQGDIVRGNWEVVLATEGDDTRITYHGTFQLPDTSPLNRIGTQLNFLSTTHRSALQRSLQRLQHRYLTDPPSQQDVLQNPFYIDVCRR